MTNISRRTFLAGGTMLAAGTALGGSALLTGCGSDDEHRRGSRYLRLWRRDRRAVETWSADPDHRHRDPGR